jgi:16S rRNA (guanine527-N7)-methyltransferase
VSGAILRAGLEALGGGPVGGRDGFGLRGLDEVADLLERYLAELDRWNARYGFVKATADELVVKHVLDSIAGAAAVAGLCAGGAVRGAGGEAAEEGAVPGEPGGVLDVGSGAGFPGIPLAIALPGVRFSLLERSGKKCAFLENCRALLGLANATVLEADLSEASGSFDVVTFRAVAPLDRFLADLARSKVAWRSVAAYKGRRDRIDEELAALGPAAPHAEVVRLDVPFMDEERHLVVLRCRGNGAARGAGSSVNLDNTGGGD